MLIIDRYDPRKDKDEIMEIFEDFIETHPWIDFLADSKDIRSNTSVCFTIDLEEDRVKKMIQLLEDECVAFDCGSYRDAPIGLRFWCGGTIEKSDIQALMPWLEWAYETVR